MNLRDLLSHHGLKSDPFHQEDAASDGILRRCIDAAHHPAWEKIWNDGQPSAALVFGDKGAGKTAIRLQLLHEASSLPGIVVVDYSDMNPFLQSLTSKGIELEHLQVQDHIDVMIALALDSFLQSLKRDNNRMRRLRRQLSDSQKLDLLLFISCFGRGNPQESHQFWKETRKRLGFRKWSLRLRALGRGVTTALMWVSLIAGIIGAAGFRFNPRLAPAAIGLLIALLAFLFLRRQTRFARNMSRRLYSEVRVVTRPPATIQAEVMMLDRKDFAGQPWANLDGEDARFELLRRMGSLLETISCARLLVIMDRIDEPLAISGDAHRMLALVKPILNLKLLFDQHISFKGLFPRELHRLLLKESDESIRMMRMDKLNVVLLSWTGPSLWTMIDARLKAAASNVDSTPSLRKLFDEKVEDRDILELLDRLGTPRNAFKFLTEAMRDHVEHCSPDDQRFQITPLSFARLKDRFIRSMEEESELLVR